MQLKIISWNMAHWTHRGVAEAAWHYLDHEIAADILLLQECVPPLERQNNHCIWREIGKTRRWGSAIVTKTLPLAELALERNDYPGAVIAGKITLPDQSTLSLISVYAQIERGYSITTLHRILSDLTPVFDGEFESRRRPKVILGGDFNASIQWDTKQGNNSHRIFFERLADFGLVDCQGAFAEGRARTLRHTRGESAWVNDYIFMSEELADKVASCEVLENPAVLSLSDHNPVTVTLNL